MRGQHHVVKPLGKAVGDDAHAIFAAFNQAHGCVQAGVWYAGHNFVHILARATVHRVPLWPVGHLNQAVVVAKPDHRRHRKAQHLVGRATPDAAQHGQKVPVAKRISKAMLLQEFPQRLLQGRFIAVLRQAGAKGIEAQQVAQHAPEFRVHQVAFLRKHGGQVAATPLQLAPVQSARRLHRKRHVRLGNLHAKLLKQSQQIGVSALIEHQKARVHPVGNGCALCVRQGHIHRVCMATKIIPCLKQRDLSVPAQGMGRRQA